MSTHTDASTSGFTALSFVWRLLAALVLVLTSFNPTGYSAYHWISGAIRDGDFGPLHLLLVGLLLAGWVVFWLATWRALNTLGVVLAGIVLGAVVWLLLDLGILHAESVSAMTWTALVSLAVILAIGVSWSHISRRLTGQINVEDVDD